MAVRGSTLGPIAGERVSRAAPAAPRRPPSAAINEAEWRAYLEAMSASARAALAAGRPREAAEAIARLRKLSAEMTERVREAGDQPDR